MIIIKWGILTFLMSVFPLVLGVVPVKYMNKFQRTPAMIYICGWFMSFAIFELVAVPFIIFEVNFKKLVIVYTTLIGSIFVYSLFQVKDVIKKIYFRHKYPLWSYLMWLVVIALIGFQAYMAVFFEHYDGDDAYYLAVSVLTKAFDSMYVRNPYLGCESPLDTRHALSPTPVYEAWLSQISGIHVATIAHSVLSVVWLVLMYLIYDQIANRLFVGKRQYKPLFLLFVNLWFIFGNISMYTTETFSMTRIWQGKGLMTAVVLPTIFLCILYLNDNNLTDGILYLLFLSVTASIMATTVSIMLVPTIIGIAALIIGIKRKSFGRFIKIALSIIPCIVVGVIYILIK